MESYLLCFLSSLIFYACLHAILNLKRSSPSNPENKISLDDLVGSKILDELKVKHVFTHFATAQYIDIAWDEKKILDLILNTKFSRIPVINEKFDRPQGILLTKDYLKAHLINPKVNLRSLCKPAVFIHLEQPLRKALQKMLRIRIHMFFVIDDYGCVDGIITLEDILEKLVGEIYDESDTDQITVLETDSGHLVVPHDALLADVFYKLNLKIPYESESVTFLGWVEEKLGTELTPNQSVEFSLEPTDIPFAKTNKIHIQMTINDLRIRLL
ncbi:MAG: CBS domain-containing protein [Deltaproteobacteria bacterium]|nr:CBS domain-containing protein [Deltaproteobacteria bacterium]